MYWIKEQTHDFSAQSSGDQDLVTAIIPVYGKKFQTVVETLACLAQQSYERLEIIIVSNGVASNMFDSLGVRIPANVKIVYLDNNMGAAYARNTGAMHARGGVLWFIDSDVAGIAPDCASRAVEILGKDPRIGAVGGVIFHDKELSFHVIGRFREEFCGVHSEADALYDDDFVNTACVFVRRSVFNRVNGFADFIEYPFDDVDFGYKIRAAQFRCVGTTECAGVHPLYAPCNSLFHEFMAMHNLLLHLMINHTPRTFLHLLRKKRDMKWRMAPPSRTSNRTARLKALFNRIGGLALACCWIIIHAALVISLRVRRQRLLTRLLSAV